MPAVAVNQWQASRNARSEQQAVRGGDLLLQVSFYLPYFPLKRSHLRAMFEGRLADKAVQARPACHCILRISWHPGASCVQSA